MSDMFKNYPQPDDYVPDNRRVRIPKELLTIMSGETTTHSFELPFNYESYKDYKAIYKLGINVVLEKSKEECTAMYDEDEDISILSWTLSPSETMLFRDTNLDAKVQLRFVESDDTIAFSEILDIVLEDSLQNTTTPTPSDVNLGFGWTED